MAKLFVIFVYSTWLVHCLEFCNGQRHRVQGGTETEKHEFPFIVSLSGQDGQHICGGTIIHEEWILTAAHCIVPTLYQVTAGVHNTEVHYGTEQIVGIEDTKIHPDYNENEFEHDIALVRVQPAFNLNQHIKVLALSARNEVASGNGTVIGWGYYGQGPILSPVPRQTKVPFQRSNMCKEKYGPDFNQASMLCAGGLEGDACNGDSGGPLICTNQMRGKRRMVASTVRSNKPTLCGIVSFGSDGCVKDDTLGVYTKVSFYRDWIDKTMSEPAPGQNMCERSLLTPLYRYFNTRSGDHMYTTNWNELEGGKGRYRYERVQAQIFVNQQPRTVPLHRFYNRGNGDHIYVINDSQIATLSSGISGYSSEGITGYVYPTKIEGSVELYRYYNRNSGDHFYTTNWNELGEGRGNYVREGKQNTIFVCPNFNE